MGWGVGWPRPNRIRIASKHRMRTGTKMPDRRPRWPTSNKRNQAAHSRHLIVTHTRLTLAQNRNNTVVCNGWAASTCWTLRGSNIRVRRNVTSIRGVQRLDSLRGVRQYVQAITRSSQNVSSTCGVRNLRCFDLFRRAFDCFVCGSGSSFRIVFFSISEMKSSAYAVRKR